MHPHRKLGLLLIMLGLMAFRVFALPSDTQQVMNIIADSTLFNYKTGFNTYEGNVKIIQGKTMVTADRVTTQSNAQRKIEEAIAYGIQNPARYSTLPKEGDPLLHAQAKIIRFYPIKSLVRLENDVVVTHGDNSFRGALIIYNLKDQTISAPASEKGQATFIIEPKQLKL